MSRRKASLLAWAALLVPVLACAPGAVTEPAAPRRHGIDAFLATVRFRDAAFSPDASKILVSSDQTGVFNAFAVPTAGGGSPVQLTQSTTDAIRTLAYFPTDERLLYAADEGGNELTHIYLRELDGSVRDLTPGSKLKATFVGWARDERSFFVTTNERDPRYFDLYEIGAERLERALLYRNDGGYELADVSPDRRLVALNRKKSTSDGDIYLHDRTTGDTRHLTPHEGEVAYEALAFAPDGESLLLLTDEAGEFRRLERHELATGNRVPIDNPRWDVLFAEFSRSGRYLVVGVNDDARTVVRLYEGPTLQPVELPRIPDADITEITFSRDESQLAFYASGSRLPRDLFVHAIGGPAPRQLTRSLSPEIAPADLVDAEVVRFTAPDGVEIPGLLYKPREASPAKRVPALVWVHGGPGGQSRVGYTDLIQFLVNHGYAVFAINNRGSSGYGKTFFKLDDRQHGEADLGDLLASKTMLAATGWIDPERIGVIGGSYGGYLVLAAMAFRPEAFAAGVDLFGVANWVRTLESIPPWWESFRQALYVEMGDPAVDGERLRRISPLFHASGIRRPLLVLQGANDPRVLKIESDEMVQAARAAGARVEYVVFDDEGHGFQKKANQQRGYTTILEFLDRELAGKPRPAA